MPILTLNDDENFNFDILTGLGQMANDGADVNPVAKKIKPGDRDSYTKAWFDLAIETKAKALDAEHGSDPVNVRAAWFSASNYFRRADVYNRADWNDPRINGYWDEQRAAFDKAVAALPVPAERVEIPSDGFNVSGTWYPQLPKDNHTGHLPTMILTQGYDAAQEDLHSAIVAPALVRGYNVFLVRRPRPTDPTQGTGSWLQLPPRNYQIHYMASTINCPNRPLFSNLPLCQRFALWPRYEPNVAHQVLDSCCF